MSHASEDTEYRGAWGPKEKEENNTKSGPRLPQPSSEGLAPAHTESKDSLPLFVRWVSLSIFEPKDVNPAIITVLWWSVQCI